MTNEQTIWLKLLECWAANDAEPVSTPKPKVQRITQLYGRPGNIIFCGKGQTVDIDSDSLTIGEIRRSLPPTKDRCICQDQHRRGHCTEPGCPYSFTKEIS